jgi:aldehyde dehydrogenase (NAD+)
MVEHRAQYIGGRWEPSTGTDTIAVVNPATEDVMGSVPAGTVVDAEKAVRAARDAFSHVVGDVARRAGGFSEADR